MGGQGKKGDRWEVNIDGIPKPRSMNEQNLQLHHDAAITRLNTLKLETLKRINGKWLGVKQVNDRSKKAEMVKANKTAREKTEPIEKQIKLYQGYYTNHSDDSVQKMLQLLEQKRQIESTRSATTTRIALEYLAKERKRNAEHSALKIKLALDHLSHTRKLRDAKWSQWRANSAKPSSNSYSYTHAGQQPRPQPRPRSNSYGSYRPRPNSNPKKPKTDKEKVTECFERWLVTLPGNQFFCQKKKEFRNKIAIHELMRYEHLETLFSDPLLSENNKTLDVLKTKYQKYSKELMANPTDWALIKKVYRKLFLLVLHPDRVERRENNQKIVDMCAELYAVVNDAHGEREKQEKSG